jgi:hypothetical protein
MRLRSVAIFGIGYLVGTRAGQDRYQQIAGSVRDMAESDVVRGYVDRAVGLARRPLASAGDTVDDTSVEAVADDTSEDDGEDSEDDGARRGTASRSRAGRSR